MEDQEILLEFIQEAGENLTAFEQAIKSMTAGGNIVGIDTAYRSIHTIKGTASFLGLKKIQAISHALENLLDELRSEKRSIEDQVLAFVLSISDEIRNILDNLESDSTEGEVDTSSITSSIENYNSDSSSITTRPIADIKSSVDDQNEKTVPIAKKIEPVAKKNLVKSKTENVSSDSAQTSIRVKVQMLEKIMGLVEELVINRNQILLYSNNISEEHSPLVNMTKDLNSITSNLQDIVISTRLVPLSSISPRFERLGRDLSRSTGKKMFFDCSEFNSELDRNIIEKLVDPLTHIIRNAVDHGLEGNEERERLGKSSKGRITLSSSHDGGYVIIRIEDDGRGLNKEKIKKKILENSICTEPELESLADEQVFDYIFHPGFSTAEKVTEISGRGVGMDVVRSNIEELGGSVMISSKEGEGTSFKLIIPLTLAIMESIIVSSGGELFAIPQCDVQELINYDEQFEIEKLMGKDFFRLRGTSLPIINLNEILDINQSHKLQDALVLILNAENGQYGVIVDKVVDIQEIVVKPLSQGIKDIRLFAGATVLGDGSISLILDSNKLFNKCFGKIPKATKNKKHTEGPEVSICKQEYLLVEQQEKQKLGLPVEFVERLEQFDNVIPFESGNREYIEYNDRTSPIIRLNNSESDHDPISTAVILNISESHFILPIAKFYEVCSSERTPDPLGSDRKEILGNIFLGDDSVDIVNVSQLIKKFTGNNQAESTKLKKALLVEDSPFFLRCERELLESAGFEVVTANNGYEALEILKESPLFDLVVSDFEMPFCDGEQLVKEMMSIESLREIPIIMVSSKEDPQLKLKMFDLGIKEWINKSNCQEMVGVAKRLLAS